MEVLFIMSSLFCGHKKPLMKQLMKPLMKSLIKSLLFAVWCATHEPLMKRLQGFFPLMKPLMNFPCATHETSGHRSGVATITKILCASRIPTSPSRTSACRR